MTPSQPPTRRVPGEKAEPCVSTCYDRASGSDTQCVEPAGHEGRHSDGCLEWEDAPPSLDDQTLTYAEEHALRENYVGSGGLSAYWGGRLFATLDASRAENAELQRERDEALEALRDSHMRTPIWDKLEALAESALDVDKRIESATVTSLRVANAELRRALETAAEALDLAARGAPLSAAKLAAELTRAALRAAENSPEARCGAEYGNACEGHGCPVHAGGEPESRESAPTAERAPDEPCKCGKLILQLWMEAVTESGDMGTDYRRHSRTACLTAAERASRAKAAAPPAAEGLTAAEWYDVAKVLQWQAKANGVRSLTIERIAREVFPCVRAAAEKAGGP